MTARPGAPTAPRAVAPRRVVVVNRHLDDAVGGSELQCHRVAVGLAVRGHEVVHLAVGGVTARERDGYRVVPVAARAADVAAAVLAAGADVVYWRFGRALLAGALRRLGSVGVPVVLAVAHADDLAPWPSGPALAGGPRDRFAAVRARLRHRASYGALRRVAGVAMQRRDQTVPVGRAVVRHVPNLVRDPAAEPDADPSAGPASAPAPWDWPRPYVAWVGNLKARKRPEACRPLADALRPHGIDVVMAGGLQDARYADLTRPDPDHPNLHHVGRLDPDGVLRLLAGARCVAVTYLPEGFSNVLLQAWSVGRPTVSLGYDPDDLIAAADLGGVAGDDPDRFAALVVALATDPERAAAAGARARAVVADRFDDRRSLDALEELLSAVAG
jgi:glycosyltransferase involved in cell wall biosynthesis